MENGTIPSNLENTVKSQLIDGRGLRFNFQTLYFLFPNLRYAFYRHPELVSGSQRDAEMNSA